MILKKEIAIHAIAIALFLFFVSLTKGWLSFSYSAFFLGGILGTFLPDIDHLLYIYFIKPHELTSQRLNSIFTQNNFKRGIELIADTKDERTKLTFHTEWFQLFFLVLTFLVISSSNSLIGRGLVLGFSLHLVVDQIVDLFTKRTLNNWFKFFPVNWDINWYTTYTLVILILICIFGIVF